MNEPSPPPPGQKFDTTAAHYREQHQASVAASGEPVEYFAEYKLKCLERLGLEVSTRVLDYGCGIGNLTTLLSSKFEHVTAYDPSLESLKLARANAPRATFVEAVEAISEQAFDLAVLAGVLHHVPPDDRQQLLRTVSAKLAPGGRLAIFEHNPYNPVTVRAVSMCEFDDDAILLRPREVRTLLGKAGFKQVTQRFIVFFPRQLAPLRPLEPRLGWCPLGAQTFTWGTRSSV